MKPVKILTEKVMISKTPARKILGFEDILGPDDLPQRYMEGIPRFFMWEGYLNVYFPRNGDHKYAVGIPIGDVLTEEEFQGLLIWLRRAGSRLAKIRRKEQEAWNGMEVVTI